MDFVKEHLHTLFYPFGYENTFNFICIKLNELGLKIEAKDLEKGKIEVRCSIMIVNVILWKFQTDKLRFKIHRCIENKTKVDIYGIGNLFSTLTYLGKPELSDFNEILQHLTMPQNS